MRDNHQARDRRLSQTAGYPTLDAFLNSILPLVLILLVYTAMRLLHLTGLPIFGDESRYILRARATFLDDDLFIGIYGNKWLYPYLLAWFRPYGPESLWLARALTLLLSVPTCAACIALGRMLHSPKAGLLAGLIYTVLPFSVFHNRQILVDPTMTTFATLAVVFSVRLAQKRNPLYAVPLTLSLAGAYLTKATALPYFAIPLAAALVLMPRGRAKLRAALVGIASSGLGAFIVTQVYRAAYNVGRKPHSDVRASTSKFSYLSASLPEALARLASNLEQYWSILYVYFGLPLTALVVLSLILMWRGYRRRALLFLWIPAVAFAALPVVATRPTGFLPARYLAPTIPPLVVIAAIATIGLLDSLARAVPAGSPWPTLATGGLLAALLLLPLPQDWTMILNPQEARLQRRDTWQYFTGDPAGPGRSETGEYLLEAWERDDREPIGVVALSAGDQIEAYMGPRVAIFRRWHDFQRDPDEMAAWLAQGRRVYFVDEIPEEPLPDDLYGALTEQVASFETVSGRLRIWQVVGADERLLQDIHRFQFIQPDDSRVVEEYPALAAHLAANPAPRAVVAYPPNQAGTLETLLADQPHLTIHAIGDQWPFDPEAAAQELARISGENDLVEVVFLQETLGDPTRSLEGWLTENLFWEAETWFGPIRLVSYQSGPEEVTLPTVTAQFGEAIALEQGVIVDRVVSPGEGMRVALLWRTDAPVGQSYKVFAHVISEEGELAAQHDGIPRGGLAPTTAWQANERTPDRFVIDLPGDMTPGTYELRVGLYDPDTQIRLPLTSQAAGGPDYVTLGQVEVR
jgi:hypothetical protein